jgi:L-amino acid N-acyltransferase YncA
MTSDHVIRRAVADDAEEIARIWAEGVTFAANLTLRSDGGIVNFFKTRMPESGGKFGFWVLEKQGKVIGWQSLLPFYPSPVLWDHLAISSTYVARHGGVAHAGSSLISAAIANARESGLAQLLGFVPIGNRPAIRLARQTGWQPCGQIPPRHRGPMLSGFDLFVMTIR